MGLLHLAPILRVDVPLNRTISNRHSLPRYSLPRDSLPSSSSR